MKIFYRVCNPDTQQGLWYHFNGGFTGLIHNEFNFCKNNELEMDFDKELVGWLSATDSLESLYNWFTKEDIIKLQKHGWFIYEYEVENYKFYDKFQHYIIEQSSSKIKNKISFFRTRHFQGYGPNCCRSWVFLIYIKWKIQIDNNQINGGIV